jgi:hypothetical protein
MKLAIKKIEYIPAVDIRSFRHLSQNGSCDMTSLIISGEFKEIPHTQETFSLNEEWTKDASGNFSSVECTFSVRSSVLSLLRSLACKRSIFKITSCSGEKMIVGSPEFRANLSFKKSISGLSSYEYIVSISCKSTHGLIYDTSE